MADNQIQAADTRRYIGRTRELAEITGALDAVHTGRGRLLLLNGEPGIGKTRLLQETAALASDRRMHVIWGRCWQGAGAPAFWPWIQILRTIIETQGIDDTVSHLGPRAAYVATLLPELTSADLPEVDLASDAARFQLFDTIATLLHDTARDQPLLLLIDDLHWADHASLVLLEFVAQQLPEAPAVVCGTYRVFEIDQDPVLKEAIRTAARHAHTLSLSGLDRDEIRQVIEQSFGETLPDPMLQDLVRTTEGNPFFVDEIVRSLTADQLATEVPGRISAPESVLDVIRRRLTPLSSETMEVLRVGAVYGNEFGLRVVADATDAPTRRVVAAIDEARTLQVVTTDPDVPDRAAFRHALIRDALYEDLEPEQRRQLHGAIGRALEEDPRAEVTELAHHFSEAGDFEKAFTHTRVAARQAVRQLAFEDAARLLKRALALLRLNDPEDTIENVDLLLSLGEAQERANDPDAEQTFFEAAEAAHRVGDTERRAQALLGMGADLFFRTYGVPDERRIALLTDALHDLEESDSAPRAALTAQLAVELVWSSPRDVRVQMALDASAMARRLGDPWVRGQTLILLCQVLTSSSDVEMHLAAVEELISLATTGGSERFLHRGHVWRAQALLRAGRHGEAEHELSRLAEDLESRGEPRLRFVVTAIRASLSIYKGHYEEGARQAAEAMHLGASTSTQIASQIIAFNMLLIAWDQGRIHDFVSGVEEQVRTFPDVGAWTAALTFAYAEAGRTSEAKRTFRVLEEAGFRTIAEDQIFTTAVTLLAVAAARLGESAAAATLYDLLHDFNGSVATTGGTGFVGPVSHALGLLAATNGRYDVAQLHLRDAMDMNERTDARPSLARSQLALGRLLLEGNRSQDRPEAESLLENARHIATELGMAGVLAELDGLQPASLTHQDLPTTGAPNEPKATPSELWRDRYEPVAVLGEGGQGKVLRARDHQHDRMVALKVRPAGPQTDRTTLLAEARVLLNLKPHPGVTLVRDDFFHEDQYVIVMEWIEGTDLGRLLADRGDPGLPLETVLTYLEPVAAALDHLHGHDPPIIHADVKPANLILTPAGTVVLVDFGISSNGQGDSQAGSPGYRAPEVAAGNRATAAADIYGLAATTQTLLTGRPPDGSRPTQEGRDPASADRIERVIRRGLATGPEHRPSSAGEFFQRLRAAHQSGLPSGVITFLMTDIEASTRSWEQAPEAMSEALRQHDAIVLDLVPRHDGRVVKARGEGDSMFCVFESTTEAVRCALALQRALLAEPWPTPHPLRVRVAIHVGDTEFKEHDYYGQTVNRCARLRGAGHGGQVLLSQASCDAISGTMGEIHGVRLANLGSHRLKDLAEPEQIYQLCHPNLPSEFPPLMTLDVSANLPVQPTPLIGRDRDVTDASNIVLRNEVRLLTLAGPGGIGKTRLALQVAAEVAGYFEHGVHFVALAPLQDHTLVLAAVAGVLDVRERAGRTIQESLREYLATKQLLLVLDNFEHVLDAAPDVAALLTDCARMKILLTSRERLNVRAEKQFVVPPLPVPEPGVLPSLLELSRIGAVELFVDRARGAAPDFELSEQNAGAVAGICVRLEGLPLAIELAAARIDEMPTDVLLEHLGARLDLLAEGPRDLPERHRTMRAAIAWSYDLLSTPEQTLLCRLAAFAGDGPLEALRPVCVMGAEVEDHVASLAAKSLLRLENGSDEARFTMLQTVHEFARDSLNENGEQAAVNRRHAEWYCALAERAEPELIGGGQMAWLARLDREHDNLRSALGWCATPSGDPDLGLRTALSLLPFWEARAHLREGRDRLLLALQHGRPTEVQRWKALVGEGRLARLQGDYAVADDRSAAALDLARELGDRGLLAKSLYGVAIVHWNLGRIEPARSALEECRTTAGAAGDRHSLAWALTGLALLAWHEGDYRGSRALYQESLAILYELQDKRSLSVIMPGVGTTAQSMGDYAEARVFFEEGLALAREAGDARQVAWLLHNLGSLDGLLGNHDTAEILLGQSLEIARELGERALMGSIALNQGRIAAARGDHDTAHTRLEDALETLRRLGDERTAAFALADLGSAGCDYGDHDAGLARLEEALDSLRRLELRTGILYAQRALGRAYRCIGDVARARPVLEEALEGNRQVGERHAEVLTALELAEADRASDNPEARERFEAVAHAALEFGDKRTSAAALKGLALFEPEDDPERALRFLAAADTLHQAMGLQPDHAERRELAQGVARIRELLPDAIFVAVWEKSHRVGVDELVAAVLGSPS